MEKSEEETILEAVKPFLEKAEIIRLEG